MQHKCDLCGKPAVVHDTQHKGGSYKEIHLCEEHAKEAGLAVELHSPLQKVLTQFVISAQPSASPSVERKCCPGCGLTFAQFRQTGTLGCPDCYAAFERPLAALLEKTHDGATHHVGKAPKRAGAAIDRQLLIQRLVKQLDEAVAAEQYERAAELRDRLRVVERELPASADANESADAPPAE